MDADRTLAVLDIGSNTVRLLVARPSGEGLEGLLDRSEFVRLGRGVDETGRLQADREEAAIVAISGLTGVARSAGARDVVAIATSAVRDASNGEEFIRRVRDETGVEVEIISGDREAYLTFLGATLGLSTEGGAIVSDLGGGSAELIAARKGEVLWATSLQLGSGRLTERFVHRDPPTKEEMQAVARHVREVLDGLPPAEAERAIFTGGTATHVAWLAGRQGEIEQLDLDEFGRIVDLLRAERAAEIAARYGIRPERAQVLPAGAEALLTIAEHYQVGSVTITRHGIREGALIDRLHSSTRPDAV